MQCMVLSNHVYQIALFIQKRNCCKHRLQLCGLRTIVTGSQRINRSSLGQLVNAEKIMAILIEKCLLAIGI